MNNKDDMKILKISGLFALGLIAIILFIIEINSIAIVNDKTFIDIFSDIVNFKTYKFAPFIVNKQLGIYIAIFVFFYIVLASFVIIKVIDNENLMRQNSKGSAKWLSNFKELHKKLNNNKRKLSDFRNILKMDNKPLSEEDKKKLDENTSECMLFSKNVCKMMSENRENFEYDRNNNVVVVGGAGSGKTFTLVIPNILQANCSFAITDPSGELLKKNGTFLKNAGYDVKVFNLIDMQHSNCYNPIKYAKTPSDIDILVNTFIKNTTRENKGSGDAFWENMERKMYSAIIHLMKTMLPEKEQTMPKMLELIRNVEIGQDGRATGLTMKMFDELKAKDKDHIAIKMLKEATTGSDKTLLNILSSCFSRLTPFNTPEVINLMQHNDIGLETVSKKKTALFIIIPQDGNDTYNFMASMVYSQLFEILYKQGQENSDSKLDIPVRFMLDEFANIGQIPNFIEKLATMRKYGISCTIILQDLIKIKKLYKDEWESLISNSNAIIYLGGNDTNTTKYISTLMGKQTIEVQNKSVSKNVSHSFNKDGRELMTSDEIGRMSKKDCLVIIDGLQPIKDKKITAKEIPNYCFTANANKEYFYDVTKKFNNTTKINLTELKLRLLAKKECYKIIGEPADSEIQNCFNNETKTYNSIEQDIEDNEENHNNENDINNDESFNITDSDLDSLISASQEIEQNILENENSEDENDYNEDNINK